MARAARSCVRDREIHRWRGAERLSIAVSAFVERVGEPRRGRTSLGAPERLALPANQAEDPGRIRFRPVISRRGCAAPSSPSRSGPDHEAWPPGNTAEGSVLGSPSELRTGVALLACSPGVGLFANQRAAGSSGSPYTALEPRRRLSARGRVLSISLRILSASGGPVEIARRSRSVSDLSLEIAPRSRSVSGGLNESALRSLPASDGAVEITSMGPHRLAS